MWAEFHKVLCDAIDSYMPSKNNATSRRKTHAQRYPIELRKAIAHKRCLWKKYREQKTNIILTLAYKNAAKQCQQLLRQYKTQQELRCIESNNVGTL